MLLQLTLELQPIEPIKEYRWITQEEQKEFSDFMQKVLLLKSCSGGYFL